MNASLGVCFEKGRGVLQLRPRQSPDRAAVQAGGQERIVFLDREEVWPLGSLLKVVLSPHAYDMPVTLSAAARARI
jgi:hypothetical protein